MEKVRAMTPASIKAIGQNQYELEVLTDLQTSLTLVCTAFDEDIPRVTYKPDLFPTSLVDPRPLTAAVLAFHRARQAGQTSAKSCQ
jgi:hypothetical protein